MFSVCQLLIPSGNGWLAIGMIIGPMEIHLTVIIFWAKISPHNMLLSCFLLSGMDSFFFSAACCRGGGRGWAHMGVTV